MLETDPNFPSGPWTGFFIQCHAVPGKHRTDLRLTFENGVMTGDGRDMVGPFTIQGVYDIASGRCHWHKRYVGKHDIFYRGFNEGKGIWGTWELTGYKITGGFHIWPEGMADPSAERLSEEADVPAEAPAFAGTP